MYGYHSSCVLIWIFTTAIRSVCNEISQLAEPLDIPCGADKLPQDLKNLYHLFCCYKHALNVLYKRVLIRCRFDEMGHDVFDKLTH